MKKLELDIWKDKTTKLYHGSLNIGKYDGIAFMGETLDELCEEFNSEMELYIALKKEINNGN